MNQAEGQKEWGWLIVFYVFLAGLGGGTFLFSFVLIYFDKYSAVARIGALVGPLVVLIGSGMLLFDLGSATRAYRLFTTPATLLSSWMIRGAWILTAFIVLGLAYALPSFPLFNWLPWNQASGFGQGLGMAAALLALVVAVYPGLLLGVIKSIPLWNTSALPPLFFLSGMDTGLATLVLMSLAFPSVVQADGLHLLGAIDAGLIVLLLIALAAYIEIVRQTGVTAAASIHLLASPLFIGGVVIAGLLLPLAIFIFGAYVSDALSVRLLHGTASVLILCGGLLLRLSVIKSGVRIAVR
ncbi:MAG TPA: NrfD/PsrC family molybdoenzyme membrane anchor subunit [Syntrophorhabdales bacterium]|nr:NrfD/PsrC family molybdoenzyme membrane anchor subunit [Syntrophorhabdales bacterium]